MLSLAEENYLKVIYHLSEGGKLSVSTNSIADQLKTKPASVSDMINKLGRKNILIYKKYQGVKISTEGKKLALLLIRKHRLWEVFLVEKLKFNWDEVHEVAEQLEHIRSPLLIKRLDEFLGYPKYDPHGDPIPDEHGDFKEKVKIKLSEYDLNKSGIIVAVNDASSTFLQYLDKIGAGIGSKLRILDRVEFDGSLEINLNDKKNVFVSREVADNILVTE
ncbi:MAG: metal-dependent transcriptional regulator [Candidatus Cyclobacteriaceae bacterium M3_2C_046]